MVTCTGFIEPLNLQCILINTFAGSVDIFIFVAFIFIAMAGAYFRMLNSTTLIMFALFAIIFSAFLPGIYLLFILLGGLISAWAVAKIVKT